MRLLDLKNRNSGVTTFHATQLQKDKAVLLVEKALLSDDCRVIIPSGDSAKDIAIDAVNEACESPFVLMSGNPIDDIYNRANKVITSWTAASSDDETEENQRINEMESVRENLADCLHVSLIGSPKQVSWAEQLRNAKLDSLSCDVLEKRIDIAKAAEILSNQSAKYWIDNRA